jgi:hypothetical protein
MSLDVMHARVAFRDRAFIDVMDLALRFAMAHVRLYAKVALFVLAPCVVITLCTASLLGWRVGWAMALLLSFVAQVPFTVLASRLVFQEQVSARATVRSAMRELPRILAMRAAWTLMVSFGSVLVAPGVWLAGMFLFVDEVMILERARIGRAFGRSQRITSGSMGGALLGVAMLAIVPIAAVLLADVGGGRFIADLQFRPPASLMTSGGSVLAVIGWFGIIPYLATARFFLYLNLRTRAEGWDIQTRFAAIAARAEQEAAA